MAHLCLHHVVPVCSHLHDIVEDVDLPSLCNHLYHGPYGNQSASTTHTRTEWGSGGEGEVIMGGGGS